MPDPAARLYRDVRGVRHEVVVRRTRGAWQVLDIDETAKPTVIEHLTAADDGEPQARSHATTCNSSHDAAWKVTARHSAGLTPVRQVPRMRNTSHRRHERRAGHRPISVKSFTPERQAA